MTRWQGEDVPEHFPDWRVWLSVEAAGGTGPIGELVKPGDLVIPIAQFRTSEYGNAWVPMVSPYRLALSTSIRASQEAVQHWKGVRMQKAPAGASKSVDYHTVPALYDFYEACMTAAVFAYQSLETWANESIDGVLSLSGDTYPYEGPKGIENLDSDALQRRASTDDKLRTIVPALQGMEAPPKGKKLWQRYRVLKAVRDATMHTKRKDYHPGPAPEDRTHIDHRTVFSHFVRHHPCEFPRTAIEILKHYTGGRDLKWLAIAEAKLNARTP